MRYASIALAVLFVLLGVAMIAQALVGGGGLLSIGVVLGLLFALAGCLRFWAETRGRRS